MNKKEDMNMRKIIIILIVLILQISCHKNKHQKICDELYKTVKFKVDKDAFCEGVSKARETKDLIFYFLGDPNEESRKSEKVYAKYHIKIIYSSDMASFKKLSYYWGYNFMMDSIFKEREIVIKFDN